MASLPLSGSPYKLLSVLASHRAASVTSRKIKYWIQQYEKSPGRYCAVACGYAGFSYVHAVSSHTGASGNPFLFAPPFDTVGHGIESYRHHYFLLLERFHPPRLLFLSNSRSIADRPWNEKSTCSLSANRHLVDFAMDVRSLCPRPACGFNQNFMIASQPPSVAASCCAPASRCGSLQSCGG
jgi:hypothetical protein